MGRFGTWEIVIILILVAIIFGGRRLPELGRYLGKGLANFRTAVKDPDPKEEPRTGPKDENDSSKP
ncbi:MAG: twin-arginine translocase TatA/TatE family subunit [Deltaproteobacteria bacterium]|jgi:sec-independent protein translocase protein TatA|nr:twin-arginine translocase TatA/TatE family subunit [Deltaproteobacteria bacterium]